MKNLGIINVFYTHFDSVVTFQCAVSTRDGPNVRL